MSSTIRFAQIALFLSCMATAEIRGQGPIPDIEPTADSPSDATSPEELQPQQPAFYVRAALDRADGVYYDGDLVSLSVVSERDAYVYVLYRQVDDRVYQIFPNAAHPNNRVKAKQPVALGAEDDLFRWRVVKPYGKESITVIASETPIEDLSKKEHVARNFNPVGDETLKGITVDILTSDPSTWAKTKVYLEARARPVEPKHDPDSDPPPRTREPRRLALFVGVSKYLFSKEALSAQKRFEGGVEETPDIEGPANGAELFGQLMKSQCDLDEARILTDEQATRANVEAAITEWLPSASRPGDTIFIYYSGHSIKIPDDNGDEPDQQDELITLHDTMNGIQILGELMLRLKESDFPEEKKTRLIDLLAKIGNSFPLKTPPTEEMNIAQRGLAIVLEAFQNEDLATIQEIALLMIRESSITDDLMGGWMQKLDGRRVVVILDTCYAGGHATAEKSINSGPALPIDFLDSESSRLKDIGQRDLAVLASASVSQTAKVMPALATLNLPRMGFFTAAMIDAVRRLSGPLPVEDAFNEARGQLQLINEQNPVINQVPQLVNDLTVPVYIKP